MNLKKKRIVLCGLVGLLTFSGCSLLPSFGPKARYASDEALKFAVLDFEEEGRLSEQKIGVFAADEMTSALFIKRKVSVVDRAQIIAKIKSMQITVSSITPERIHAFGEAVGANYLIFGKITAMDNVILDPDKRGGSMVCVTCRLIAVSSGEVVGMVKETCKQKNGLKKELSEILERLASTVEI